MEGSLIIISSPSGGGKGTLIGRVRDKLEGVAYSVSHTTREVRAGEVDGVDYHFVSAAEFEELIGKNEFLEFATVHGNYYGTSKSFIERETAMGRDVILEIDVQGAALVRERVPRSVGIFILPPSFEVLRERLAARMTESGESLGLRLANAKAEVYRYSEFDFVIINDSLDVAEDELRSVIVANRLARVRQEGVIRDILFTFGDE